MENESKKKYPVSRIVAIALILIPFAIGGYNSLSEESILLRILFTVLGIVAAVFGSMIVALIGGFILHFARKFTYWITNDEPKEKPKDEYDDVITFVYGLWPFIFAIVYYEIMTGKGIHF